MSACQHYCEFGESLVKGASKSGGLPRCIMLTYPAAILLLLILILAIIQLHKRRRNYKNVYRRFNSVEDYERGQSINQDGNSKTVDDSNNANGVNVQISNPAKFVHGDNRTSFFFTYQQFLHLCLAVIPVVDIITKAALDVSRIQGVTVFYDAATCIAWIAAFLILRAESFRFFKARVATHSVGLLLFWSLAFINENLSFISWDNENWWFVKPRDDVKKAELGLFVARYAMVVMLFLLGLKAPGLYKPEPPLVTVNEEQSPSDASTIVADRRGQSAFKDVWKKTMVLWPFMWPQDRRLQLKVVVCFLLLAAGRAVNVLVPYTYKLIVDRLNGQEHQIITDPLKLIGLYVFLRFMSGGGTGGMGALNNLRSFFWIKIQQFTSRTLQVKLFEHLHNLSLRWHITRKTGEVITMVNRGSTSIYNLLSYILFSVLPTIADIIIAIVYFIAAFNGWFGLIVFMTMALYLLVTILLTEWRTRFRRAMNIKDNDAKAKAVDSLLNFETVKYYSGEQFEVNRLNDLILGYQDSEWEVLGSLAILNTAQNVIITCGLLTGAMYCGHLVSLGTLGVGDFVLYITYIVQLYVPLNFFGTYYRMIQQSFIDMENMFDLFSQRKEVLDIPNAPTLNVTNGLMEFKDVCFYYDERKPVLKKINFTVYPGQTIALVGNSGGGKSTIIRLLYRFYDVCSGSITIDGQDISKVTQQSLRQTIGVVPQDTVLFNNDIRFNIRYGRLEADDDAVEEAAQAADIHSRILSFPEGYKSMVGERGLKLSGGEKQRVAIARTVLKNPPMVLLDEATSALDTETERHIQASLNNMCINRTTIVVAHRLSTIINADQILVIQEGEIVEKGRHDELLASQGLYANMWRQQSKAKEKEEKEDPEDEMAHGSSEEEKDTGKEKTA